MNKIILINNFDDVRGGELKRVERFKKILPDIVVVERKDIPESEKQYSEFLGQAKGIILTGSDWNIEDQAKEDGAWIVFEKNLILQAAQTRVPVLGVCFGHQLLCSAFGATVRAMYANNSLLPFETVVKLRLEKEFDLLPDFHAGEVIEVGEHHSQHVLPDTLPKEFTNYACPTGVDCRVQLVKHVTLPLYGTQFHPECCEEEEGTQAEETGIRLLKKFAKICEEVRK